MILTDLVVVFAVAGGVVFAFQHLKLPSVVGLLVSGVVVGPNALGWISETENVHLLAEIGVVVLLFSVGLEFSLTRMFAMSKMMLQIGIPQVVLSVGFTALLTWHVLGDLRFAIFVGMLVAMSSTAVVIKLLADRSELNSLHGRVVLAVLLLQDLLVVLCVLAVPLLSPQGGAADELFSSLGAGLGVVSAILIGGKYLLPRLLYQVVRTRNRELFLIMIFVVCIGTAVLTGAVGLSLALGAFLAGLTLSESEYGHQTLAEVLPFRDTLSSLFFISVGMLLDVHYVFDHPLQICGIVAGLIVLKFLAATVSMVVLQYPLRTTVLSGIALAQIGEFSFVLADSGRKVDLLTPHQYQAFLAAAVVTMVLTPFTMMLAPRLVGLICSWHWLIRKLGMPLNEGVKYESTHLKDHVIIAGFGFNGRNLARVLKDLQIPYLVLDTNPETVRTQLQQGESIHYGDCTRPAVLQHAGIEHAKVYVVAISDPISMRRTVQIARQLNPQVRVVVRTRYQTEINELVKLGADQIVPEDFETSVEIFSRVLRELNIPTATVRGLVEQIRENHYQVFKQSSFDRAPLHLAQEILESIEMESCRLPQDSAAVGKTIGDLRLRSQTGASVITLRRGKQLLTNPGADQQLEPGDTVVLLGNPEQIASAIQLLGAEKPGKRTKSPDSLPVMP